jgi:anthranilate/para-aminobenzoate synthase component I
MAASKAHLMGAGWGEWRGGWISDRCLVCRSGVWALEHEGREEGRWPDFKLAMECLWPQRRRRGRRPWIVGWVSYEEAARMAGGLPTRGSCSEELDACWLIEPQPGPASAREPSEPGARADMASWSLGAASFECGVDEVRRRIAAGDVYQVNLCRRLTVPASGEFVGAFVEAASAGGVPDYLATVEAAGHEVVCASMELLLSRRSDRLVTRPIKGTRPRGADLESDRRMKRDLETDPKEQSELAMIVDLERNDLGRICRVGSVRVADPGSVKSYATVHHLVASVEGRAREDVPWWRMLAVMSPGGSVTGCPKRAAMSVVADLEPTSRGPFTGALGVVAGDGDLEMALPIRTAWRMRGELNLAAGCGIVWHSDPGSEERESRLKISRWLELLGMSA